MEVLYRRQGATVSVVLSELSDPPGHSALRAILRELEEKGHVEREAEGAEAMYRPTMPGEEARERALERLVRTFFGGAGEATRGHGGQSIVPEAEG